MAENGQINVRQADFSDIEFLWYLRNRENVYQYIRIAGKTPWEDHLNWIMPVLLGLVKKQLFLIEFAGKRVGQLRFDEQEERKAEIGISLLSQFRGRGIAGRALSLAIEKLREDGKTRTLLAEIHQNNLPSLRLFEKLNFKLKSKDDLWLNYELEL